MADELDLLRAADPVPEHGPHFGDGPLDHRAERGLERLLAGAPAPETARTRHGARPAHPGSAHRRPARRVAWGLAASAAVIATVSALLLADSGSAPAVAAPAPLEVRADSARLPLDRLAERAHAAAGDGTPRLLQGTHVRTWSLGMAEGKPPVTHAEERLVRRQPDGGRIELVVPTDPRDTGAPALRDDGGTPRPVDGGADVTEVTHPPSWTDAPPGATPPNRPDRLRAYLTEAVHDEELTTPELLDAVAVFLDHWTPGARESAALARVLADAEGLRPAGQVTDRLGRPGQAYTYEGGDAPPGVRRMLIMDPGSGTVLGLETTFTADQPAYGAEAGDVMEYRAWMR
ncbi:CU044_5270 family protein [Streptomyces sp. NPDC005805]|uniref:CU044_5270 family protein n=1 Tax=Streptomyces sp. NPDC005805 TaxID=3157068 RepID=UPI0033CDDEC7